MSSAEYLSEVEVAEREATVVEASPSRAEGGRHPSDGVARIQVTPAITRFEELPPLPPQLIDGILFCGGKLMLSGASKSGKSLLLIELAVAVATGTEWVGFPCVRARALYLNLEIQTPQFMHRVYKVCERYGVPTQDVERILDIANLRGKFSDIEKLVDSLLATFKPGDYDLIIVDPAYKIQSGSENDADAITAFCAQLDRLAEGLRCTIVYSHHHSKGAQGGKNAEDRASGSGVFTRDADAVVDMIELECGKDVQEARARMGCPKATPFRLEFVVRDLDYVPTKNIWFTFPVHVVDPTGELAGTNLRKPGSSREWHEGQGDKKLATLERKLDEFMGEREEVNRKEFASHIGWDPRTVTKYVRMSARFDIVSAESSATIRRVRTEGQQGPQGLQTADLVDLVG